MSSSSARALARVLLARIPPHERGTVATELAQELQAGAVDKDAFATAELLAELGDADPQLLEALLKLDLSYSQKRVSLRSVRLHLVKRAVIFTLKINLRDALRTFVLRAIKTGNDGEDSLRHAVELCTKHQSIGQRIFRVIEHELLQLVQVLRLAPKTGWYALPTTDFLELSPAIFGTGDDNDVTSPAEDIHVLLRTAIQQSRYLKILFWLETSCCVPDNVTTCLLALLGAANEELSLASKDALSAFFASVQSGRACLAEITPSNSFVTPSTKIWHRIKDLMLGGPSHKNMAFVVWLKWIALPEGFGPLQDMLASEDYWSMLQYGLLHGSSEQRKYCLHILRHSCALVERDVTNRLFRFEYAKKGIYEAQYDKYCTIFETMVLGRYPNQVKECLPDLERIMGAEVSTVITTSWFVMLIEAALQSRIPDGIRKIVGTWLMDNPQRLGNITEDHCSLLTHAIISWAAQGFLFTSSIRKAEDSLRCQHGGQLSNFVVATIRQASDTFTARFYVSSILSYMCDRGANLFAFAGPYILDGIVKGLQSHPACLGLKDVEFAVKLASRAGLFEVVRDVYAVKCREICRSSGLSAEALTARVPGYRALSERCDVIASTRSKTDSTSSGFSEMLPVGELNLERFMETLQKTNHKVLHGGGLVMAIEFVREVINTTDPTNLRSDNLYKALEAIWSEIERQDYPKRALMEFPGRLFHPRCIPMCSENIELADFLSDMLPKLQRLSDGRIYVFSPLLKAIRTALLEAPETANHLHIADFVVRLADHPPSPRIEFVFESIMADMLHATVPSRDYSTYYGRRGSYGYACFFDLLNRLNEPHHQLRRDIFDRLLQPWMTQKLPVPIVSKWKTTVQLQIILILSEQCIIDSESGETTKYLALFMNMLAIEPLPRYRFLLEWIIVRLCVRNPASRELLLDILASGDQSNPKHMASVLKMAVMVAKLLNVAMYYSLRLMTILVTLAASPKIVIRHEAQWAFPPLWDHADEQRWTELTSNPAFEALNAHIRSLDKYITPPPGRMLEWFDPIKDHTLATLFQGAYLQLDPPEAVIVTKADFEAVWMEDTLTVSELPPAHIPIGEVKVQKISTILAPLADQPSSPPLPPASITSLDPTTAIPLQTKGTAWQSHLPRDGTASRHSTDLLLVASLIDNTHNLGGLSRCAEIFGARSLHIRSLTTLKSKDFTSVAVSSEAHIPITELPPAPTILLPWLQEKKVEGYTVVGVEQTDRSLVLGAEETALPRRCVLVMGSEREGIPGWLLAECDVCVEVRQVGVTRSLNVQTAAAVVLFEYQRQHGACHRDGGGSDTEGVRCVAA